MAAESGGGAATNSGVRYQNRVAAYLLATALCGQPTQAFDGAKIETLGFETAERVDDLNVSTGEKVIYLQIKRELSFSMTPGTDLQKTLVQFVEQHLSSDVGKYFLVTTSDSSRRISLDMRVALDAYRSNSSASFFRDQAQAITGLIDKLRENLVSIARAKRCSDPAGFTEDILRRIYVFVIDIDEKSPLEQATLLILAAQGYLNPELLWAKLISDCLTHSTRRHTISVADERKKYAQFARLSEVVPQKQETSIFKVNFENYDFPVGREVILGTLYDEVESANASKKLVLMEFRRFGEDCERRLDFKGRKCHSKNGLVIDVLRRTATFAGLLRYIDRHPEIIEGKQLVCFPFNSTDDLQKGLCAELHLQKMRDAAISNPSMLNCMRCGRYVSSLTAELVELEGDPPQVGLIHDGCLQVTDRLLGTIQNDFFRDYSFLINFDANGWFQAIERGQGVFSSGLHTKQDSIIAWGGRKPDFAPGDFLVECMLVNGESEYCFERGKIHRFTKQEANAFAERMNELVAASRRDPMCYSDQSCAFGSRSELTKLLGVKENLRQMTGARVVRYDAAVSKRYELWHNWYAPLLVLQAADDGAIVVIGNVVPVLTNPLELNRYIENWRLAGFELESYQTTVIYTDRDFDDFMSQVENDDLYPLIDPLLNPSEEGGFAQGTLIRSIERLTADSKAAAKVSAKRKRRIQTRT